MMISPVYLDKSLGVLILMITIPDHCCNRPLPPIHHPPSTTTHPLLPPPILVCYYYDYHPSSIIIIIIIILGQDLVTAATTSRRVHCLRSAHSTTWCYGDDTGAQETGGGDVAPLMLMPMDQVREKGREREGHRERERER